LQAAQSLKLCALFVALREANCGLTNPPSGQIPDPKRIHPKWADGARGNQMVRCLNQEMAIQQGTKRSEANSVYFLRFVK
jgi:hypothetical protein